MPKVPYPYEVNGKLVTGNGFLIPICSLSNRSLLPSLTVLMIRKAPVFANLINRNNFVFMYISASFKKRSNQNMYIYFKKKSGRRGGHKLQKRRLLWGLSNHRQREATRVGRGVILSQKWGDTIYGWSLMLIAITTFFWNFFMRKHVILVIYWIYEVNKIFRREIVTSYLESTTNPACLPWK